MASQFVRKITDTSVSEPIKETTTSGDLIITKDDKVLINLNGTLKDLIAGKDADNTYVQKSGDTMTGTLTAPQLTATDSINGFLTAIKVPDTTTKIIDLINNDFINGRGLWKEATFIAFNSEFSDAPTNDAYAIIKLATRGSKRTYVEYSDLSGNVWHTTASTNTLNSWVKQANDSEVVHNTGNETVAGNKTLTGLTTMLTGNYGLRVTSSGFEKTTDGGKTWATANI